MLLPGRGTEGLGDKCTCSPVNPFVLSVFVQHTSLKYSEEKKKEEKEEEKEENKDEEEEVEEGQEERANERKTK